MLPQWIIEKKRDNKELSKEEISSFINGFVSGEIADYQMSALAMAIYFNGMTMEETAALTEIMMNSGSVLDPSSIHKPKIDKHSTGGIGDKISLILAPLAASCGIAVPMISGRGLGITGGTLDKLESIPGYRTDLSEHDFLSIVEQCGCSIIGQTAKIAPADKRFYAIRDVTGTVPSIPLITASILSKKLAAGLDALVMDVKFGRGAFMKTVETAKELALTITEVGARMKTPVTSLITDMNSPLGRTAGNALEIREVIEVLKGHGTEDLILLTLELCAQMLLLGKVSDSRQQALTTLKAKLDSGEALETFRKMITLHGGDPACVDNPQLLPEAPLKHALPARSSGIVLDVDAEKIGKACLILGAGRKRADQQVNHSTGISGIRKTGEPISAGEPLAIIHAQDEQSATEATTMLETAFKTGPDQSVKHKLIHEIIPAEGTNI